ncbi:MAG: protein kinase [Gemmatimonadaceae bacterium]
MSSRGLSLTLKVFVGTAVVVVVILGVTLAVTARSATAAADASVHRVLGSAREALNAQLSGRVEGLLNSADVFASNPNFRDVVRQRRFSDVLDQSVVATEQIGADWVQIVDAEGIRLAKSDEPQAEADTLAHSPAFGNALEGSLVTGFGVSGDTMLVQVAVVPIADDSRVYGALMAARNVDAAFAGIIRQQAATEIDVLFYLLDEHDAPLVSGSTVPSGPELDAALEPLHAALSSMATDSLIEIELAGQRNVAAGGILRSAGGFPLGGFVLLRNRAAEFAAFNQLQRTIFLSGGLGIVFAALFSLLVARWVTRPVAKLAAAARRASDGDYAAEITATSRDEIGALASAFRQLLADLREKQQLVEFLSGAEQAKTVQLPAMTGTSQQRIAAEGLVPGSRFAGRYEVKEILGEGGMGTVFKAVDTELGEVIAIKTLKGDFLDQDPTALERFKSEIRLARRISHRNVVRTHDLGESGGIYYITMEYVEGRSLRDLIKLRGKVPVAVALSVGKQLARALEIAHEQGVIHRDIKPHNMVVEPNGVLKVMDFGIARLATRPEQSGVTQAGMIVGTPEYMSPEQVMGKELDARADIYSAGCVLYECVTGKPPITAETPYQLIARLLEDVPVPPRTLNPDVPPALDALIVEMLAKEPAARPANALAVHDRLAGIG